MKTINIYFFYLTRRATGFHHLEQLFAHGIYNKKLIVIDFQMSETLHAANYPNLCSLTWIRIISFLQIRTSISETFIYHLRSNMIYWFESMNYVIK